MREPPRPLLKVCGITRTEDLDLALDLGIDLIGLNLWPGSPRGLSLARARELAERAGGRAEMVGIFVDRDPDEVERLVEEIGLDLVQLHGDETPDVVERLAGRLGPRVIKVFRVADRFDRSRLSRYPSVWGYLFDCRHPSLQGGTGESWSYEVIRDLPTERPILVAGGIGPGRVRRALGASGADGVDVCSAVERTPGVKNHELMRRLAAEVEDFRRGEEIERVR